MPCLKCTATVGQVKDTVRPAATVQNGRVFVTAPDGILGIRYANGGASMQAHQRLVLLVNLLAMAPLNPDESVRHDGGACCHTGLPCGLCLNTITWPAKDALSLAFCQHAKSSCRFSRQDAVPACAADTCSSSPVDAWWHSTPCSATGSRALAQTTPARFDGHSRYPHGISTPTACLPAFALPTATTTSGMPCPATACEPRSICVVPCTPRPPFVPVN